MTQANRLGRYEIVRELGRGGMGIVLEGRDPMIDRPVALKIIKISEMGNAMEEKELKERFFIEAKAAGRLIHPHIVTIYDVGEEEGKSFMAMEFVEGEDLAGIMAGRGAMPLDRAARIVAQIADGLAYAHEHHIVHRDVKPGNILITSGDRVKITDFGLARLTTAAGSVTQTGHAVGSPSYMSPEQVQGHPIDGRSDLFSLGVLFFELVTGRRPFEGEGLTNIIFKIIKDQHARASDLNPALPRGLDRVIDKMLAKHPEERYRNGHEVASALAPYTTFQQTELDPDVDTVEMVARKTIDFESDKILEIVNENKNGKAGAIIAGIALVAVVAVAGLFVFLKDGGAPSSSSPSPQLAHRTSDVVPSTATPTATATATATPTPTPVPEKAHLTITPSTKGTVSVDGKPIGPAPVKEVAIDAGPHTLGVTAPGYLPWQVKVDMAPGEEATFAPRMALAPGSLQITSTPSGMEVAIDGKPAGTTPMVAPSLKPGEHTVVLSGVGVVEAKRTVAITDADPATVAVKMVADTGKVVVKGPKGASILVDGKMKGTAPATLTLPTGRYSLALAQAGYHTKSVATVVERGKSVTIDTTLRAKEYGSVRVTSIPWAEVWINGKKIGPTPRTVDKVEEGKVNVRLENPGYRPYTTSLTLAAGQTMSVSHVFAESEEVDTPATRATSSEKGALMITSRPPGVVFIDGRHYGTTPVKAEGVAAGERKVVIKRNGLPDYARTITVVGGIVTRLAVE